GGGPGGADAAAPGGAVGPRGGRGPGAERGGGQVAGAAGHAAAASTPRRRLLRSITMSDAQAQHRNGEPAGASLAEGFDELTSRLQAGAVLGPDELERLYPRHAAELRRLLPALAALGDLSRAGAGGPGNGSAAGAADRLASGELGDYRIVREVG